MGGEETRRCTSRAPASNIICTILREVVPRTTLSSMSTMRLPRTADALAEISSNLVAVAPTLDGIEGGLREAVARSDNYAARLRGANVNWPTSWDQTFDPRTIGAIREMLWRSDRADARAA